MNDAEPPAPILRGALVVAGIVAAGAALRWGSASAMTAYRHGRATFDDLLVLIAAGGAWLCLAWFGIAVLCVAAGAAPAGVSRLAERVSRWATPALARRLAGSALSLAVATSTTTSMTAQAGAAPVAAVSAVEGLTSTEALTEIEDLTPIGRPRVGVPTPDPRRPYQAAAPPTADGPVTVVVAPGDSLWSIAANHLQPGVHSAAVAAEWPRWFAANRDEIGADPDLIHPGAELRPPPPRPSIEGAPR